MSNNRTVILIAALVLALALAWYVVPLPGDDTPSAPPSPPAATAPAAQPSPATPTAPPATPPTDAPKQ